LWQDFDSWKKKHHLAAGPPNHSLPILISIRLQMKVQPWVRRVISFWRVVGQFLKISYLMRLLEEKWFWFSVRLLREGGVVEISGVLLGRWVGRF